MAFEVVNWIRVAAQFTCLSLPTPTIYFAPFMRELTGNCTSLAAKWQMAFSALRYDSIWPRKRCKINKFAAFWPHLAHFNCILSQKQKALANTTNFPPGTTTHLHRVQCQQRVPSGREYWSARSCRWSTAQRVPRRRQQHRHPHGYLRRVAPLRGSRTVGARCPPLLCACDHPLWWRCPDNRVHWHRRECCRVHCRRPACQPVQWWVFCGPEGHRMNEI